MDRIVYCLVDAPGNVYAEDGAEWYTDVAAKCGLNETECRKYRFDLTNRRRLVDWELSSATLAGEQWRLILRFE